MSKKEEYQKKMEAQLKEWGAEIELLKAKTEKEGADLKIKYLEQINQLQQKQEQLKGKMEHLRESGSDAWEELKAGIDKAGLELKSSISEAMAKLKKHQD